ncbi:hypothetical protein [Gordonia sp. N1V]|uniref:hypothetical protein n=1 Tax=Gordonia sp. N1V TaxID=3034163 RepID=UPI0023E2A892|nr:hypothetical protein [Gordonia sp. N1V]MDF3282290.1 hypothetical protein [Gordonia sp. N1V]
MVIRSVEPISTAGGFGAATLTDMSRRLGDRKVMVAVWGSGQLLTPTFRADCASAGVRRLQINISDDAVQGAMRISTFDPPIDAVISVWAPDAAAALESIDAHVDSFAAWEVQTRAPLDPTPTADGTRVDALANIALLRRPQDLAYDEWLRIWLDEHTQVAIDTQATFGYYQNIVERCLTTDSGDRGDVRVTGIVEELFPMAAISDPHAFYGSDGDDEELQRRLTAMLASVARFGADRELDVVPTSRYDFSLTP